MVTVGNPMSCCNRSRKNGSGVTCTSQIIVCVAVTTIREVLPTFLPNTPKVSAVNTCTSAISGAATLTDRNPGTFRAIALPTVT
jgi:hypothetical protein